MNSAANLAKGRLRVSSFHLETANHHHSCAELGRGEIGLGNDKHTSGKFLMKVRGIRLGGRPGFQNLVGRV